MVLIFISLMTSDDEHFSYVCWPHICLILKSVCSYPLPTLDGFVSCKSVLVFLKNGICIQCSFIDCFFSCAEALEFN